jgi:hypothetical protein
VTVAQLIKHLQSYDPTMTVYSENGEFSDLDEPRIELNDSPSRFGLMRNGTYPYLVIV